MSITYKDLSDKEKQLIRKSLLKHALEFGADTFQRADKRFIVEDYLNILHDNDKLTK